jgi:hypothetical protein
MNYIIIILLSFILIFYFYNQQDNFNNQPDNFDTTLLDNTQKIDEDLNCYLFGCNSNQTQFTTINFIGYDNIDNPLFVSNTKFYLLKNNIIYKIKPNLKTAKLNNYKITVPVFLDTNKNIILKIKLKFDNYDFCGYLTNNYYHFNFLVYYKLINNYLENLYEYILININKNDEYIVKYTLPERTLIYYGENIWINYGIINLGPYKFTNNLK